MDTVYFWPSADTVLYAAKPAKLFWHHLYDNQTKFKLSDISHFQGHLKDT